MACKVKYNSQYITTSTPMKTQVDSALTLFLSRVSVALSVEVCSSGGDKIDSFSSKALERRGEKSVFERHKEKRKQTIITKD